MPVIMMIMVVMVMIAVRTVYMGFFRGMGVVTVGAMLMMILVGRMPVSAAGLMAEIQGRVCGAGLNVHEGRVSLCRK